MPAIETIAAATLADAVEAVRAGRRRAERTRPAPNRVELATDEPSVPTIELGTRLHRQRSWPDLADVRGQLEARRALEIALAGGHGLLLIGPPGSGKTLLARTIPGSCRR